jgi:CO/xanthine dehydrogenase Mo-binding subunit
MDELAFAARIDPVEFRIRHLTDIRAHAVIRAAAEASGWGTPLETNQGRGIAYARYENEEAYLAAVATVHVDTTSGAIKVDRIVLAHDCGLIINPDGLRNQIEGNVIQSLSRALKEQVKWEDNKISSVDWDTYPILKFSEVPDVEVVLINRPDERPVGAGEPATITTAPAIANAVFNATGARLRQVPFTPARVRQALTAKQPPAS